MTSRDKNSPNPIPMAGFPYHALEGYLQKLIRAGFRAAICEQVEDPKTAKGLVKREVVQIVTPGVVVDDEVLFDGEVTGVRIEPTIAMPGLRARTLSGRFRPKQWVAGRAAQLGTTGALVVRDGKPAPRPVRRSTFYRHTQGWLRVAS